MGTSRGHEGGVTKRSNGGKRAPTCVVAKTHMEMQHPKAARPIKGGVT